MRGIGRHSQLGGRDEIVAAAEALPVSGEGNDVHLGVEVRALHTRRDLPRHLERDSIAALGSVQGDARNASRALVRHRRQAIHGHAW